eukprot:TRINITY_DN1707_c0_g1_i2.p1 TRINITY_DN1707_c0_g1~~TRINITY_DN1707_c0_g1_i2.p1  ORF type:complete len:716 (+),score=151.21 TRINITY_DN1707_c0_g1_i2:366-2513(+)
MRRRSENSERVVVRTESESGQFSSSEEEPNVIYPLEEYFTPRGDEERTVEGETLSLSWSDLVYEVEGSQSCSFLRKKSKRKGPKVILNHVDGHVNAGELMALMGPSGSGKSTLLDVLAGRVTKGLTGDILVNGAKPDRRDLKRNTAYMSQDDTLHIPLTVRETLYFSAMLRLPREMTSEEKENRIDEVIEELGLTKAVDTKIGDNATIRGISGGERRRVSIGIELMTKPALLLVDEPTSGLDSKSARFLIELLRKLTRKGKTIICTIHQPSSYVFSLFDKVGLLSKGNAIFFGDIKDSLKFFNEAGYPLPPSTNPADFMIQSINNDFREDTMTPDSPKKDDVAFLIDYYKGSSYAQNVKDEIENQRKQSRDITASETPETKKEKPRAYQTTMLEQFFYLTVRLTLSWGRNPIIFGSKFISYLIMAIAVGSMFYGLSYDQTAIQDRIAALCFCTGFLMYISLSSINALAYDRKIFIRERMNGYYSVLPYALSNIVVGTIFIAVSSVIFTFIVYYMVGFNPSAVGYFVAMLLATLWCAEAIVSVVSALIASPEAGMGIVNAAFSLLLLTNGFFVRAANIPGYWIWLHWIGFCKYSFEGLLVSEFVGQEWPCILRDTNATLPSPDPVPMPSPDPLSPSPDPSALVPSPDPLSPSAPLLCDCFFPDLNRDCVLSGDEIVAAFAYEDVDKWAWFGVIMGMTYACHIVYYLALRFLVTGKR